MNEHLVSAEAEGYTFTFGISRTTLRIAGLCAVVAGAILAVLINATEPFRIPLGIALGVLALILLIAYAFNSSSREHELNPAPTERTRERQVMFGRMTRKKSLAAELALLAELHRSGALSDEEFSVAKRRILGGRSLRSAALRTEELLWRFRSSKQRGPVGRLHSDARALKQGEETADQAS